MRLFAGIPMPESCLSRLAGLRTELGDGLKSRMTWVRPGNFHLTLRFLGEVDDNRLEIVTDALGSVRFSSFSMCLGGGGCFPSANRPRSLWVGLDEGAEPCTELARAVNMALKSAGVAVPDRFAPHVTLARIRTDRRDDWKGMLARLRKTQWPAFDMSGFVLWRSELGPDGPVYTRLATFMAGKNCAGDA